MALPFRQHERSIRKVHQVHDRQVRDSILPDLDLTDRRLHHPLRRRRYRYPIDNPEARKGARKGHGLKNWPRREEKFGCMRIRPGLEERGFERGLPIGRPDPPAPEVPKFSEESKELELEPEILPDITWCLSTSGKRNDAPKAKPLKPKLKERKALQDVSNILKERKGLQDLSNTVKGRPALRSHDALKNPVKIFTVEETKKWHEWANDVSEGAHSTANYPQKLDKDVQDKRDKALVEDSPTDDELDDYPLLELDDYPLLELDDYPFLDSNPVKFELKDDPVIPDIGAN